uniref:Uncharacterized protein n=1 Tax=Melopsittacus undulatus TaxID=13146 RepID=A0A8C6IY11_MELUD
MQCFAFPSILRQGSMLSCHTWELMLSPSLPWRKKYLLWKVSTSLKLYQRLMRPQVSHFTTLPANTAISPVTSTNAEPTITPTHTLGGTPAPADAISQAVPVSSAAQHKPNLPMPAQTEKLQASEHPNLPKQPQHPVNPSQLMHPQPTDSPAAGESPLAGLLLYMPLEPQQSTGKKKQEEDIRKIFVTSPLSHYFHRVC